MSVRNLEWYRSGHNELDSKSSCRVTGTWVRIPPSPLLKNPVTIRVAGFFFLFENVRFIIYLSISYSLFSDISSRSLPINMDVVILSPAEERVAVLFPHCLPERGLYCLNIRQPERVPPGK